MHLLRWHGTPDLPAGLDTHEPRAFGLGCDASVPGGPVRSRDMLLGNNAKDDYRGRSADYLLAFPQPGPRRKGSGTWACIDIARDLGIPVILPGYTKPEPEALF